MQQGPAAQPPATSPLLSLSVHPASGSGRPDPPDTIRAWLASAHDVPTQARAEWTTQKLALLPLGRHFAAVRIPGAIVHAAVGTDDGQAITHALETALPGPVIHDVRAVGPTYWALVPWRPGSRWRGPAETRYLGPGTYLGIPDIGCTEPPGSYWVTQPRYRRDLCHPEAVLSLIALGSHRLRSDPP
ncbi:hypothetical protein AB0B40_37445 [Streptomyces sp. NPDC042638]|uniref:hypothetical protein n=1 Tax=Streptomyces sp. NPDC042638 TaxID=3154333 RepID=UPI00340EA46E